MCRAAEIADLYTRHAELAVAQRRPADGAGLEEMFLELTADTQRDTQSIHGSEGAAA